YVDASRADRIAPDELPPRFFSVDVVRVPFRRSFLGLAGERLHGEIRIRFHVAAAPRVAHAQRPAAIDLLDEALDERVDFRRVADRAHDSDRFDVAQIMRRGDVVFERDTRRSREEWS